MLIVSAESMKDCILGILIFLKKQKWYNISAGISCFERRALLN